nr:MAG TPA: hypothetical protein [Bacteriophage sp.]
MKKIDRKELYNLDHTIIEWVVPRLKAFKEYSDTLPWKMTKEEWEAILDKIILGLEAYSTERDWDDNLSAQENLDLDKAYYAKNTSDFQDAMELLTKYFGNLWY